MRGSLHTFGAALRPATKTTAFLFLLLGFNLMLHAQDKLLGLTSQGGPKNGGTAFSILGNGTGFTIANAFSSNGGYYPYGDLTQGNDGNFYGMTYGGGTSGYGTIFKVTPTGAITVLKNLDYYTTGGYPYGSLTKGSDGNFYGMTYYGGSHGVGVIFKITPAGAFTLLKNLHADSTGAYPKGSLIRGYDGYFYGMTYSGGTAGYGTIFRINSTGTSFTKLKSFDNTTGGYPQGNSLVQGPDSTLYGMTTSGGTGGVGVIFKIKPNGTSYGVLKNLDATSGYYPYGRLIRAADGYLYGMASSGGSSGYGTLFRISTGGSFSVRRNFVYASGARPYASLVQGTDGLLYGMTYQGGTYGYGTIFKIATGGSPYTVLKHLNTGTENGTYPYFNSLIQATDGAFYGMTYYGGSNSSGGTVFKITSAGAYTLLLRFPDEGKGYTPYGSLVQASDGYFYGVTYQGGLYNYGTAFRVCPNGSFTSLRSFDYTPTGGHPQGNDLLQAKDGNFYGMNTSGGTSGYGTIYRMTPGGTLTVLKKLDYTTTGGNPYGRLVAGDDTTFYGTTYNGGKYGYGTIFKITSKGAFKVLKNMHPDTTGSYPQGSLVKGSDGNFYGMAYTGGAGYGTIFKITPAGVLTVIKKLDYYNTGAYPYRSSLILGTDGFFYGMTYSGGAGYGIIFKINSTGSSFTKLKSFDYTTTGGSPYGSLVQGTGGILYGMTYYGGTNGVGTIFKIATNGTGFAVLRHLKKETDGGYPYGSLVIQKPAPVATPQSVSAKEDTAKVITLAGTGGVPLTYAITTAPKNGTLTGSGPAITYKPKANYYGKDSFYFTVTWGCLTSASAAKVLITISQVNDAPVLAAIGNKTVAKGTKLSFTATATDADAGQTKTFSLIGAPSGATIGASSGIFSWTPAATGTYVFKVRVTDNGTPVLYDEEAITVTVTNTLTSVTKAGSEGMIPESLTLSVSALPNPTTQYFTLTLRSPDSKTINLRVVNDLGQVVEEKRSLMPNSTLQIGHQYLPGHYLVQVQQGSQRASAKLTKQ